MKRQRDVETQCAVITAIAHWREYGELTENCLRDFIKQVCLVNVPRANEAMVLEDCLGIGTCASSHPEE